MSPEVRRQELLKTLCYRRQETYGRLARDFNVSVMTIRRDIAELMCSYPIETVHGGRHGCVRVADDFFIKYRDSDQQHFTPRQADFLREVSNQLAGDDLDTLNSILDQFAP